MLSNGEAVVVACKETLRYGLFLGSFAGTFVSVDECIAALGGHRRMWTCVLFRIFKQCSIPPVAMGMFPTCLAPAIEKKSRRIEISLYCFAHAIESFFTCMADVGLLPESNKLKRAAVIVFSLSTAIIMHCYARETEVFRSKYLNVLDWVFGVPPSTGDTPRASMVETSKQF
ncbi:hypothetical protein IFM89_028553 [Coptis chinensis]|uniref:Uncharacterized protein n=1 Tax=Coptis chinensis TaxID=261450 RepID=A0A835M4H1_9MAGN|nr:hypothetical protein IFM89_028553 [Coptis chinensis]